jgi:phosphatidylinositol phospholipase C gamma-1
LIYHGHTLTSKIRFRDVIDAIKEHAFEASEYPLVLSIEDHCSLLQQRTMATLFQDVFGDMLVVAPLDKTEMQLPPPEKLKRKIILKHKKLPPEGVDDQIHSNVGASGHSSDPFRQEFDIASSVKNGILYVQDNDLFDWKPHFFVLTENKMFYSEVRAQDDQDNDEEEEEENQSSAFMRPSASSGSGGLAGGGANSGGIGGVKNSAMDQSELHFSEPWFHRIVKDGRSVAVDLIKQHAHLGDGTFLVRPSETFVGGYSMSFLRKGEVHHVPIKDRQMENGLSRYYLIDQVFFDSLYSLVSHYQTHPLRSAKFNITLSRPVPPQNPHEGKVNKKEVPFTELQIIRT